MAEVSGGTASPSSPLQCSHCDHTLPRPSTLTCDRCGQPQVPVKQCVHCYHLIHKSAEFCQSCMHYQPKSCLLCKCPIAPSIAQCPNCLAPKEQQDFQLLSLKQCINQQCQVQLVPHAIKCYSCKSSQSPRHQRRAEDEVQSRQEPPTEGQTPSHQPMAPGQTQGYQPPYSMGQSTTS